MSKAHEVPAGEFKAHCLRLIEEVNRSRIPLIITKHGKPMARLVPLEQEKSSLYGCLEGTVIVHDNIIEDSGELWEADA